MSFAVVHSRANLGIHAPAVTVEVHISGGLPSFSIVGLAETAVKESRHRVRSALIQSQFEFPSQKITVNLAPADLPKEGGRFDLPIAIGILAATRQISDQALPNLEFAGELALSGVLRPIVGALAFALATQQAQRGFILPLHNRLEASLAEDIAIYPAHHLLEVCAHLAHKQLISPYLAPPRTMTTQNTADLSEVKGQWHARRALEIAAAGGHSLLMTGPPGTGKTMLAQRLPGLLPELTDVEAIEIAVIASTRHHTFDFAHYKTRPFRAPHHTASAAAMVGGGNPPIPGEISLAHRGVLFLDELPEFGVRVLETLREPLESGRVTIARSGHTAEFPAQFQLVAAMNPCPCGYAGNANVHCQCTPTQIQRYRNRLSGPLLDRIDLHVEVSELPASYTDATLPESTETIRVRVTHARAKQCARGKLNAQLPQVCLDKYCVRSPKLDAILDQAMHTLGLSLRSLHRILRVARTIADLSESEMLTETHLMEALSYRRLDRRI